MSRISSSGHSRHLPSHSGSQNDLALSTLFKRLGVSAILVTCARMFGIEWGAAQHNPLVGLRSHGDCQVTSKVTATVGNLYRAPVPLRWKPTVLMLNPSRGNQHVIDQAQP